MASNALIFPWSSLALASCMATVFLSSTVAEVIVMMVRLMRSGDWTIRDLVRVIASEMVTISPLRASCPQATEVREDQRTVKREFTFRFMSAFFSALSCSTS